MVGIAEGETVTSEDFQEFIEKLHQDLLFLEFTVSDLFHFIPNDVFTLLN